MRLPALALGAILLAAAPAAAAPWERPAAISGRLGGLPSGHDLAVGPTGAVVAAWAKIRVGGAIEAVRRERPSQRFGTPIVLERRSFAQYPSVAVAADGRATVGWLRAGASPLAAVLPISGPADPPVAIAPRAGYPLEVGVDRRGAAVALFANRVDPAGAAEVVLAAERPAGAAAFSPPLTLGETVSSEPALAVAADGRAIAAWIGPDGAVRAASREAGAAWQAAVRLSGAARARAPAVAIGEVGDGVVAWVEDGPMVAVRDRAGAWSAPPPVAPGAVVPARGRVAVGIAPLGDAVALAWQQGPAPLSLRVAWRGSPSRPWRVSAVASPPRSAGQPALVVGRSGDALVAWADPLSPGTRIRARRVPRAGAQGPVETVSTGRGARLEPRLVIGNGGVVTASWVARISGRVLIVAATRRSPLV